MSTVTALDAPVETVLPSLDRVEIGWRVSDGSSGRGSVPDSARVRFEACAPVRGFPSRKGQRHLSGRWWSATTGGHVGYESWLERDHLMLLDFDCDVVGIASQPFWLYWPGAQEKGRAHAPDYFARRADGSALVVDCRPPERIRPRDAEAFAATEAVCTALGWDYRVVGAPESALTRNLRWLAGYRHERHHQTAVAAALRQVCETPAGLMAAASEVGDPVAVLPVLFHLMWRQELTAELTVPLHPLVTVTTRTATAAGAGQAEALTAA